VQITARVVRVNCTMITKIYKAMIVAGSVTAMVIITYYLNFPIDMKSIRLFLKTKMHVR